MPTYPPSGTFNELAPWEEYDHLPDLPSDHHSDQYASAGGVFTHGSSTGLSSMRQMKPGCRCT
jgi:hypothetical protein